MLLISKWLDIWGMSLQRWQYYLLLLLWLCTMMILQCVMQDPRRWKGIITFSLS